MRKTRLLFVDDAAVVPAWVAAAVATDPAIELIPAAAGRTPVLERIATTQPHVVAFDLELLVAHGPATLREIRDRHPRLPVIMLGAPTHDRAAALLEALASGAHDFVVPPSGDVGARTATHDLLGRIRAHQTCRTAAALPVPPSPIRTAGPFATLESRIDLGAVTTSTGGTAALLDLLPRLPADLRAPVVVVPQLPPVLARSLAERLAARSALGVSLAGHDQLLLPGHIWIVPASAQFAVVRHGGALHTTCTDFIDAVDSLGRPAAADALLTSVAQNVGAHALTVILTGLGDDSVGGCAALHAAGARIVVQDEASSAAWCTPGSVLRAGLAHGVWSLTELGRVIADTAGHGRFWGDAHHVR